MLVNCDINILKSKPLKIGQLVKSYIPLIINYCKSKNPSELIRLQDKAYSKETLGINFPFIVRADGSEIDIDSMRFWKKVYKIGNKDFRFCSQWYEYQRDNFLTYLKRKGLLDENKYQALKQVNNDSSKVIRDELPKKQSIYYKDPLELEASEMSIHYRKFYYLERSLRALIEDVMIKYYGENWWNKIDYRVNKNVENNLEYELSTTHTKRSHKKIDYTTFGDLRKIINNHWDIFESRFERNLNSVNEVLIDLNRIRTSIAHCTALAKKEVRRFELRIDDWNTILK